MSTREFRCSFYGFPSTATAE